MVRRIGPDRTGPWIVFRFLDWLGRRKLSRLRLECRLCDGFVGFGDLDRRIADGGADVVGVEFEAAALLSCLGLPVALHESACDDDPGPLADAGSDHVIRQRAVCDAADERGLAVLPFAVPLGAAGLRDPEGDDGLPPAVRLGSRSLTMLPIMVMGIWLIVAMMFSSFVGCCFHLRMSLSCACGYQNAIRKSSFRS